MKFGSNWLLIVAVVIVLMPGLVAVSYSRSLQVGLIISQGDTTGTAKQVISPKYTCGAAREKLVLAGYRNIKTLECEGNVYSFTAIHIYRHVNVNFHAISGAILRS